MKERARMLGGNATIVQGAKGGTEVKIVLPTISAKAPMEETV